MALLSALALLAAGCGSVARGVLGGAGQLRGIHKIQHVVMIMQENRSFDSYFGTYPGADGIPMKHGRPTVCVHDRLTHTCVKPFHDPHLVNEGGPHDVHAARRDFNAGRMNGFIASALIGHHDYCAQNPFSPDCTNMVGRKGQPDAMGWHDAREIPNYWSYAEHFVLQDHLFEATRSWSLPSHLAIVSGWSAACTDPADPMSCHTSLDRSPREPKGTASGDALYPWTDITYLLHQAGVSWAYYVAPGTQPDCADGAMFCAPRLQDVGTPEIWNPLPDFLDVQQDGQLGNIEPASSFVAAALDGSLPSVSWIVPDATHSEHPPA